MDSRFRGNDSVCQSARQVLLESLNMGEVGGAAILEAGFWLGDFFKIFLFFIFNDLGNLTVIFWGKSAAKVSVCLRVDE